METSYCLAYAHIVRKWLKYILSFKMGGQSLFKINHDHFTCRITLYWFNFPWIISFTMVPRIFNFTNWTIPLCRTAQLGYGAPPEDKVSSLVVGVISAGLGIPVILILFGGLFVIIKKKMAKGEYTEVGQDNSSIQWDST